MKRQTIVRLLTTVLVILMLSIATSITAFAGTNASAYVTSNGATSRGEAITFSVGISNGTGVQSILIIPTYDSSAFELVSGAWTLSGGLMSDFSVSSGDGAIAFNPGISVNGTVLTFTLKAKADAPFGTQTVSAQVLITDSTGTSTLGTSGSSVQIKCNHNFTKEDTSYLKSEATCTSPAVYYKSCATCGAQGTETFNYGTKVDHSYTKQDTSDAYRVSKATCTAQAVYKYRCETCDAAGTETYKHGTVLNHSFTKQVIEDAYKVSDADCDSKAVYKYCCETCTATGTKTFEYGSTLGHTGGTATCTTQAECTRCHQLYGSMLEHVYTDQDATATYLKSPATCTSKAVYYKNCATCDKAGTATFEHGSTESHSYTKQVTTDAYKKSNATCTAKAVYYYCCATCDAKGSTTYESGSTIAHSYTKKDTSDTYKKSSATCTDAAVYYYCCATCSDMGENTYVNGKELGHTGGTATCTAKAVCTRCAQPYGNMLPHTHNQEVVQDKYLASAASCTAKAKYYKSCFCGDKGSVTFDYGEKKAHVNTQKIDDLYLKSKATCTAKAVYYESCSVCGEKGTATFETGDTPSHNYKTTWSSDASAHWHECSKCGDKKDTTSHTAGAAATETTAQTCTVCKYVITPAFGHTHSYSSSWSSDADNHWYSCSGCNTPKDKGLHSYKNACDTDCDVCGYVRTITHSYNMERNKDAEKHWYECSVCGDKKNETAHTPGVDATETTDQTCTVCGYVIKEALAHTHNHNAMKNDETNHWNECACGDKTDVAVHTWGDGVVTKEATYDEEGEKTFTCLLCSYTKTQSIDKLIHEGNATGDTDADVTESSQEYTTTFVIVIVAVLAVVAIVCGVVIFLKKKKA